VALVLFLLCVSAIRVYAQNQEKGMNFVPYNYRTFSTSAEAMPFSVHPEEDRLPYNAPCINCKEDISRRTENTRFFTGTGPDAGKTYSQAGYTPLHMQRNGQWVTIDTRLRPAGTHIYTAEDQHFPTLLDLSEGFSAIRNPGGSFRFNRNLELFWEKDGMLNSLGTADYSDYTAGEEGAFIRNIWPGIDMEVHTGLGNIKTNFILRERPQQDGGSFIIRDHTEMPAGWQMQQSGTEVRVANAQDQDEFSISECVGYDASDRQNGYQLFHYRIQGSVLDIIIPLDQISAPQLVYPYTIDPLVNSANTLAQASIIGSRYSSACFSAYCSYYLNVPSPANATITDITWSFNYQASGFLCYMSDGAITLHTGGCNSPNAAGFYWFCNAAGGGTCTGSNISVYNHLGGCMPAPSCTPQNIPFEMRFYRCWNSASGCSNSCISAASPWTMTLVGRTVEVASATVNGAASTTICQGQSATLNGAGNYGIGPYTYTWNPGALNGATVTVSPASTTTYTLSVTDACMQTVTQNVTVNVTPAPASPVLGNNGPLCAGQTLNLTSNTGTNLFWTGPNSFSSTLQNPVIAPATTVHSGTYSAYTVSGGCTSLTSTMNVVINPIPATPVAGSNSPVCTGQALNLTSTAASGNIWSGPNSFSSALQNPSIPSVTAAAGGTYSVYAVASGCTSATATVNVVVNTTPATPVLGSNSPICAGQTLNLTSSIGAGINWSGPNSFTSTVQNPSIASATTAASGTYSAYTAAGGCTSATATINVTVNPVPPVPVLGSNGPICAGQTLNLTSSTGTGINWSGPNSFTSTVQNPSIAPATTAASGTYSAYTAASGCTSATATINVAVNPVPPTPVPIASNPVCVGQPISFTSTATSGNNWSGPGGFSSTLQNPSIPSATLANAGAYSVYVVAGGCTSGTAVANVNVFPVPPTPVANSNSPLCAGQTLNLSSSEPSGNVWTGPNSFSSTVQNPSIPSVTAAAAGSYSVYTVASGCTSGTATVNVVVNSTPATPVLGTTPVCAGQNLNLTSNVASGINWSGPNSFNSTVQNPVISPAGPANSGTYSAYAVSNGCTSATATVNAVVNPVPPTPVINSNSPICAGQNLQLSSNMATGMNWSGPNSFTSTVQNPLISGAGTNASGTYTAYNAANGCTSATASLVVTVNATPAAPVLGNNGPLCAGATLNLTSDAPGTYWNGPNSFISATQNPVITPAGVSESGVYNAIVVAGSCTSAISSTTVIINPVPPTPVIGTNSPLCQNSTLTLNGPAGAGYQYYWSGPNAFGSNLQSPSVTNAQPAAQGTYSLYIVSNGCTSGTATAAVTILPVSSGSVSGSFCPGGSFTFNGVNYSTPGVYPVTFSNQFGCDSVVSVQVSYLPSPQAGFSAPSTVSLADPVVNITDNSTNASVITYYMNGVTYNTPGFTYTFTSEGTYSITQYVSNGSCTDSLMQTITVNPFYNAFVPNAYSPNKDGLNDEFKPVITLIESYRMLIFNRWGELIFESDDIYKGWNGGMFNNLSHPAPPDVYVYRITYKEMQGKQRELSGHVTLLR